MNVGGAARRKTYDPAHRPRRIGLRPSKHDTDGSAAAPAARCKNCLRWGSFILNLPLPFTSFDHLVGEGEERGRHVEAERAHPAKSCRPLEFLFLVADIPNADYFARCVPDRIITESRTVCRGCRLRRRKPHLLLIFTIAFPLGSRMVPSARPCTPPGTLVDTRT